MVLEDRRECPSFLFFDVVNPSAVESSDRVLVTVYRQPENVCVGRETPLVSDLEDKSFWFTVKKVDFWSGYGLTGIRNSHLQGETEWVVDEGCQGDPLFRFNYRVPGFDERFTAPVEFVKEHANVTIKFVHSDQYESSGGIFPFRLVIRGNTCGINCTTGVPVRGSFLFEPEETFSGTFHFILPRQADPSLTMELWAKPGQYSREGLIDKFNLAALFVQLGSVNWEEKNLPDLYLEIDYAESEYRIDVKNWEDTNPLVFEM